MAGREEYGIDAPGVVRTLGILGVALLICGVLPRSIPGATVLHNFWPSGLSVLAACAWMLASSLWLKKRVMRALLQQRNWCGNERVLDIGCGRGLVAIEAARHVPKGMVHGIDIWQTKDLSGNSPKAILANATAAGVTDRLTIDTGDARKLPYADESFDVVLSMTAIHNIPDAAGRRDAIAEAWRVLRPGGQILIFDIRYAKTYFRQLKAQGADEAVLKGPIILWGPVGWRFTATKPNDKYTFSQAIREGP
jgi:arsenite methyltransferase